MNLLFTICGRAGSKGVKSKNIRDFLNCPIMYYTLAAIGLYKRAHDAEHRIVVALSTDSEELICQIGRQHEIPVEIVRRSGYLAGDTAPKVAGIADCMEKIEASSGLLFDMVVDLDITSPLRTLKDLEAAVALKASRMDTDAVYSVTTARRNPYFNMVKENGTYFSPVIPSEYTARQQAPSIYDMNASIYAYAPDALKTKPHIGFFNTRCCGFMMKDTAVLDIDSEEDFELMQLLADYFYDHDPAFADIRDAAKALMA